MVFSSDILGYVKQSRAMMLCIGEGKWQRAKPSTVVC